MPSGGANAWYLLCRPLFLFGMLSDLKLDMGGFDSETHAARCKPD